MRTDGCGIPNKGQLKALTKAAHPADLTRRHARHERIGLNVPIDDCARSDESVFADHRTADNGAISSQRRSFTHQRIAVLVFATDGRSGVVDIGEHHAWAAKHVVVYFDTVVYRHVVLDLYVVADPYTVPDKNVLPKRAPSPNACTAANMHPMPDPATLAYLCTLIDNGGGMNGNSHANRGQ